MMQARLAHAAWQRTPSIIIPDERKEHISLALISIQKLKPDVCMLHSKTQETIQIEPRTEDTTLPYAAIPFLPLPAAILLCTCNILVPGLGTILSGFFATCCGQSRLLMREMRYPLTILINMIIGVCQLITITFFLVGWLWSVSWGVLMVIHAKHYARAVQLRKHVVLAADFLDDARRRQSIANNINNSTLPLAEEVV